MSQAQPPEKKWLYACMLFGTNSHKEGAMWHVDPLLGNDTVNRQRPVNSNRGTVFSVLSVPICYKQDS
jgi:hypothetical protein